MKEKEAEKPEFENKEEDLKPVIEQLRKQIEDSFLTIYNEEDLIGKLNENLSDIPDEYKSIFNSFIQNILSIVSIAKIPILMSFERTIGLMYNELYVKEKILSLKMILDEQKISDEERFKLAQTKASEQFNEKIKTKKGNNEFWFHSLKFILDCSKSNLSSTDFLKSSKELINQTTLLTWSACEVLLRDYFIISLNTNPSKIEEISKDKNLKSKFDFKSISTDKLIEYNFDLSKSMGNILIDNFDFSNIDIIKSIYKLLNNDESLNKLLKSNSLWMLYQRRNLLVHRGGIIDKKYIQGTGCKNDVGEKLYVKTLEFKEYVEIVKDIALQLMIIEKTNQKTMPNT
jgi:hypothetical protein